MIVPARDLGIRVSAVLVLVIAIGHIFMPDYGYEASIPASLAPEVADHFYYLGTWAICSFLFLVAILSLRLAGPAGRKGELKAFRAMFGLLSVALWGVRLILEFVYPVDLKIFLLEQPHAPLTLVIAVIMLGYLYDVIDLAQSEKA